MKNLFILLSIVMLSSCKKDRVCTCTYPDGSLASEVTFTNVTRKEAKSLCITTNQNVSCVVN